MINTDGNISRFCKVNREDMLYGSITAGGIIEL